MAGQPIAGVDFVIDADGLKKTEGMLLTMDRYMERLQRRAEKLGRLRITPVIKLSDCLCEPIRRIRANLTSLTKSVWLVPVRADFKMNAKLLEELRKEISLSVSTAVKTSVDVNVNLSMSGKMEGKGEMPEVKPESKSDTIIDGLKSWGQDLLKDWTKDRGKVLLDKGVDKASGIPGFSWLKALLPGGDGGAQCVCKCTCGGGCGAGGFGGGMGGGDIGGGDIGGGGGGKDKKPGKTEKPRKFNKFRKFFGGNRMSKFGGILSVAGLAMEANDMLGADPSAGAAKKTAGTSGESKVGKTSAPVESKVAKTGGTWSKIKKFGSSMFGGGEAGAPSELKSAAKGGGGVIKGALKVSKFAGKALGPLGFLSAAADIASAKPGEERNAAIRTTIGRTVGGAIGGTIGNFIMPGIGGIALGMAGDYLGGKLANSKAGKAVFNVGANMVKGGGKAIKRFGSWLGFGKKDKEDPVALPEPQLPPAATITASTSMNTSMTASGSGMQASTSTGSQVSVNIPQGAVQLSVQDSTKLNYDEIAAQISVKLAASMKMTMENRA